MFDEQLQMMGDLNIFLPGQVWKYDTRFGDEGSTITVLKIDELDDDAIIHVRIDGIKINSSIYFLGHTPFGAEALQASLTGFVKHLDELPEFEEGYRQWKQAFDAGKAGYWKMSVKEALDAIDSLMNKPG